uniref:Uncharacterized protein n=1 Tax=Meloidogyne enterolobii TaxID=390850 RepID=A0A6V7U1I7_MELEN|nr:unnamed protein product [Meloidogyne enterolobii]
MIPKTEVCDVLFHCFERGLTIDEARKEIEKLNSTKRTSLTTIKYFYKKFKSIEKNKSTGKLLNSEEGGASSASQDKDTNVLEGDNEAQDVDVTGFDYD